MNEVLIAFIIGIILSIITVIGDFFVKKAGLSPNFLIPLIIGAVIYGATAIGWMFVMKKITLAAVGVVYGVSCIILLTLIGVFYFGEKINIFEIAGIILGIISIALMYRFA